MMNFILFVLATIGLSFIITQYYIFKWLRDYAQSKSKLLGKLLNCNSCVGFWSGLLIQFLFITKERVDIVFVWSDLFYIIYGFIGSLVSYVAYLILRPLMDKFD